MDWKSILREQFSSKNWEDAVTLMENVTGSDECDLDAYLNYIYLLEHLLLGSVWDLDTDDPLLVKAQDEIYGVFDRARSLYSDNPDFLFWGGWLAVWGEWLFKMTTEDAQRMMVEAHRFCPGNILFCLAEVSSCESPSDNAYQMCVKKILSDKDTISYISAKGTVGDYMLSFLNNAVD